MYARKLWRHTHTLLTQHTGTHKATQETEVFRKQRHFIQMTKRLALFLLLLLQGDAFKNRQTNLCTQRAFTRTETPFTQLFCAKKITCPPHEMCFVADTFARNRVCTQTLFCTNTLHVVVTGNTSLKWHFYEHFGSNPCLQKKRNPVLATKILIQKKQCQHCASSLFDSGLGFRV